MNALYGVQSTRREKGMKEKFEKLYVRLLVYDDVDLGLFRSMYCKEFSIIFRHYFASMFVWNIRTFK